VFADPHVRARGMRIEMPHAAAGMVPMVANPMRLSASPVAYRLAPPTLGQHTDEVLGEWLHLTEAELHELHQGAIL
jgi:crotonobetainyl-CoA:carnitine CoA-transferase CaiB-like acyl-CoA transferase